LTIVPPSVLERLPHLEQASILPALVGNIKPPQSQNSIVPQI